MDGPRPYAAGHVLVHYRGRPGVRKLNVPTGATVSKEIARLRDDPRVSYANPDYVVKAASACGWPDDPGHGGSDCWRDDQWNFLAPPGGVDAEGAWQSLINAGQPGGRGTTVAVLDTGIAYRRKGRRFRRDPDLPATGRFVNPRDLVGNDRLPLDQDGHGTHVASTIAQSTDNAKGLTGLAYGVDVMPVRVLNRAERGTASDVTKGIRYAAEHGADVINLSLEFKPRIKRCSQIPEVCKAVRHAIAQGVVVVAAAGNQSRARVAFPAAAAGVIGVGASTLRGCLARYSDFGKGLDLLAPGGGLDRGGTGNPNCAPAKEGPAVRQFSLKLRAARMGDFRRFGIVALHGTSMAAAHVSAAAALLRAEDVPASGVAPCLESHASAVPGGKAAYYGAGVLDAANATAGPCS